MTELQVCEKTASFPRAAATGKLKKKKLHMYLMSRLTYAATGLQKVKISKCTLCAPEPFQHIVCFGNKTSSHGSLFRILSN